MCMYIYIYIYTHIFIHIVSSPKGAMAPRRGGAGGAGAEVALGGGAGLIFPL